ncbi:hypothetical protein OGAPHI_003071 [Ogataea philodendri]|uniref:Glycerol uptake protein 1 n=1 Tax=Ogataea philodendri TaxID=1378263 RepID=A0A9P8P9T9_9ASCO|nr:uncharacterized protein OGAPHI_003071 [Ogataea philodendri]KAH3667422.1 hypothetical protein OGAPHI_003071 [Ogataea philodendri]
MFFIFNPMISSIYNFFALESLDARLCAPANPKKKAEIIKRAGPSRWKTLEFKFYAVAFLIVVPLMVKTAMEASNETNPNYYRYERILSDGWLFGRKVDNSDSQYRFFRDNIPMLTVLMVAHLALKNLVTSFGIENITFDFVFGLVFLFGAHGFNCLRILFHAAVMYALGRVPIKKLSIALLWIYGIGTLFLNDRYRQVRFSQIVPGLESMDSFKGLIERWDVFFNFTLLRLLSFNLDYLWREQKKDKETKETKESQELNERERQNYYLEASDYSLSNYMAYVFYTPLFIAGPILTFNDYIYQSRKPLSSINWQRTAKYGVILVYCMLLMEFILHYIYVVAVSKAKAWDGDTPFQISMIGLFNLNIIWLKLLIPWRLFRFWALCDGIDTPENMIRCMDNNYSTVQFWRAWHRSYNKWVVRYVYVPLGGSQSRILASLAVFTFVAVWHDIELRLLIWGWLVVLFLLPEMIATQFAKPYEHEWWFRHLCAFGAIINIWMMMLANLFGFCLGKDGLVLLLKDMFTTLDGYVFFILSSVCLWIAVQVMFEWREEEKRRGVDVKC